MSDNSLEKPNDNVDGVGKSEADKSLSRARAWERDAKQFPWERWSHTEYNIADRSCRQIHKILFELEIHGTISVACKRAGLSSRAFTVARNNFPSLVEATELAISMAVDNVEAIAFDCAMLAKSDPRYLKALEIVLKCKGGWRETQRFEHTGAEGGPIQQSVDLSGKSTEELEKLLQTANTAGVESKLD